MKLLNKNTDYAITALCKMAENGREIVAVSTLARELKLPHSLLRKILQELQRAGVLSSRKGTGGGFKLAMPPHAIIVYDIIEIFQGAVEFTGCTVRSRPCHRNGVCTLQAKLNRVEKQLIREFQAISIQSLIS